VRGLSLEVATSPSGSFTGVWTNVDAEPLTSTRVNALFAGLSYFNIHTTQFPGGEIRGQLEFIPEPTTLLLLVSGLGGLAAWRKMRTRLSKAEP
jgi:hypothetical protein